jgi:hypothetical protein
MSLVILRAIVISDTLIPGFAQLAIYVGRALNIAPR